MTANGVANTLIYSLRVLLEVRNIKPRPWQGCVPSGGFRRKSISLLSPASRGCPPSWALGPFLCLPGQQHAIFALLWLPASLLKDPCDHIRPTPINQHNLPINILHLLTPTKSPLSYEATYTPVPGIRIRTSLGGCYLAHHMPLLPYPHNPDGGESSNGPTQKQLHLTDLFAGKDDKGFFPKEMVTDASGDHPSSLTSLVSSTNAHVSLWTSLASSAPMATCATGQKCQKFMSFWQVTGVDL